MNTSEHNIKQPTKRLYNIMFIHKLKKQRSNSLPRTLPPAHHPTSPLPFTPIIKYNIYYNNKIMQIDLGYNIIISEIYNTKHISQ